MDEKDEVEVSVDDLKNAAKKRKKNFSGSAIQSVMERLLPDRQASSHRPSITSIVFRPILDGTRQKQLMHTRPDVNTHLRSVGQADRQLRAKTAVDQWIPEVARRM